jgi:hypothetical protein
MGLWSWPEGTKNLQSVNLTTCYALSRRTRTRARRCERGRFDVSLHKCGRVQWDTRASSIWRFVASQPPGDHPRGAYLTTLGRDTPNLAARLRIPKAKVEYFFEFTNVGDLKPLRGGRGSYIFYSPEDYEVGPSRQLNRGKTEET